MSTPLNPAQWDRRDATSGPTYGERSNERTVHVNQIDFSQMDMNDEKVGSFAKAQSAGAQMAPATAAFVRGRYVIQDGHHRVAAAIKRGRKTVKVKVF